MAEKTFIPIEPTEEKETPSTGEVSVSDVQKAKDAAEIQKYETERIEAQRKAVFAENDITDTEDLRAKIKEVVEQRNKLAKDVAEWERTKATEKAGIEHTKVAQAQRETDLNNQEQQLNIRELLITEREQAVEVLEKSLNAESLKRIEKEREDSVLANRLQSDGYKQFNEMMNECLGILYKYGARQLVYKAEEKLDRMWDWANNGLTEHFDELVKSMAELVDTINRKAGEMARQPKKYPSTSWNGIVDVLDKVLALFPEITPDNWVANPEADILVEAQE